MEAAEIPWAEIDRLVLVDTRQKGRLRHCPLLEREGLEIEIWDHHPDSGMTSSRPKTVVASVGASTSLLCAELEKRGIVLTGEEATLSWAWHLCGCGKLFHLFIHHPGRFSGRGLASWARAWTSTEINEMASHQLTGMHIQALNSLMGIGPDATSSTMYPLFWPKPAWTIILVILPILPTSSCVKWKNLPSFFTIGRMGDRIQVVARSRNDAVNVGDVCAKLLAAAVTVTLPRPPVVRGKMITEVRDIIVNSSEQQGQPAKTAREYVSAPAIGVGIGKRQSARLMS